MTLTRQAVEHTGAERYEMSLTYGPEALKMIDRMTPVGQIIPDTVILVWVRHVGEQWQRYTQGQHGSRAVGHMKLAHPVGDATGVRRSREIFMSPFGEVKHWVEYLPGLRNAIADAEAHLPTPATVRAQAGLTR